MRQTFIFPLSALIAGVALCQIGSAQQLSIKRTDLLKTNLADLGDKEMNVWVADVAPGAAPGLIDVASERDKGTTVELRLPVAS